MLLALLGSLAIVVSDHASVRSTPRLAATELMTLWQGDVVELRGEQAEYLKVYSYRRERGGFLRAEAVRQVTFTEAEAPQLLAVMRFLRETPGAEALGISYGAAYLKAAPPMALTAEPFDAIGQMAERLADTASGNGAQSSSVAARLEVVGQFGVRMRTFERDGRMQVCYDGELYRQVLTLPGATAEQRAHAALGLTRFDCIDPEVGATARVALDEERRDLLERISDVGVTPVTRSRLRARRAAVWAAVTFAQARRGQSAMAAGQRALAELTGVRAGDLGEAHQGEYVDAVLRVSAVRWAAVAPVAQVLAVSPPASVVQGAPLVAAPVVAVRRQAAGSPATQLGAATAAGQTGTAPSMVQAAAATSMVQAGAFSLSTAAAEPGQTCVTLQDARQQATLARRCTYGIVWLASAQSIPQTSVVVLSVQPLESWRELWVFHQIGGKWLVEVLSPGLDAPEQGYVEFAGFAPGVSRVLLVREVKERTRYRRWFEEIRLDDLVLVRQASAPELLRDFGRWQDVKWRRETLALR